MKMNKLFVILLFLLYSAHILCSCPPKIPFTMNSSCILNLLWEGRRHSCLDLEGRHRRLRVEFFFLFSPPGRTLQLHPAHHLHRIHAVLLRPGKRLSLSSGQVRPLNRGNTDHHCLSLYGHLNQSYCVLVVRLQFIFRLELCSLKFHQNPERDKKKEEMIILEHLCVFIQTTILIDWLIGTSCYSAEVGQNFAEKKVESVQDKQKVMGGAGLELVTELCLLQSQFIW